MMLQDSFCKIKKLFRYFTVGDLVLTFSILAIAIFLLINNLQKDNQIVRINHQNRLFGEFSLSEPRIISITPEIKVEIADNKTRMLSNSCPNQLCVEQGWSNNFPIICVPNQVEIIIVDKSKNKEFKHILK